MPTDGRATAGTTSRARRPVPWRCRPLAGTPTQDTVARSVALASERAGRLASWVCGGLLSHFGEGKTFVLCIQNPMTSKDRKYGVEEGSDVEVKVRNADAFRISLCESVESPDGFLSPRPLA